MKWVGFKSSWDEPGSHGLLEYGEEMDSLSSDGCE